MLDLTEIREPSLPSPGSWRIDPTHTEIAFVGRHLGLTKTRGRFDVVDGYVQVASDPAASEIDVTVDMASVSTGLGVRDDSLRSELFFDVAAFPTATFRSTHVTVDGTEGRITGDLTIRGVTRTTTFDATYHGLVIDPKGEVRACFSAATTIDREKWGVAKGFVLETGGVLISRDIRIEIDGELVQR